MKLEDILLHFTDSNKDAWTLSDAFRGVQIFGGIGSGKTSGSGKTIATALLENGFGGVVLCAKPDERESWEKLAKSAGREKDLRIFTDPKRDKEGNPLEREYFFNPFEYQSQKEGGGETFNLVNLFMQIYQMGRIISGEGMATGGERFWDNALKRCIGRMIDLLKLADEDISVYNMQLLITTALSSSEVTKLNELREDMRNGNEESFNFQIRWSQSNYYLHCHLKAFNKKKKLEGVESKESAKITASYYKAKNYFEREFANLAEKTKTIIVESFLGMAEPFLGGILNQYFGQGTSEEIKPEVTHQEGKIIILDFPIKKYLDAGVYAQSIYKLLWQQSIEQRKFKSGKIPVFLWVDESQMFLSSYDQIFQTTARSAGVCTVFLSQNISNYYVAIGGSNSTARVNSLLGNLSTKIFHANNDFVTNEWASKTIGKEFQDIESVSGGQSQSFTLNKQLHWQVSPKDFGTLRNGGEDNEYLVDGVITLSAKEWSDGKNYLIRSFHQLKQ